MVGLILVSPVIAQEEYTGSGDFIEQPEPGINPVECGDGVCQPEIQGACPQDCVEGYSETNNSSESSETSESSEELSGLVTIERVTGFLTLLSGLLLVSLLTKRKFSGNNSGENSRNKELERNMRKLLRQNNSLKEVEKRMISNGYQQNEIEDAKTHIDPNLLYGNY